MSNPLEAYNELALRIVNGAVCQTPDVIAVSMQWPQKPGYPIKLQLYKPTEHITLCLAPSDLGIEFQDKDDPRYGSPPHYWHPSSDPVERIRQLAESHPFNKNPWLSTEGVKPTEW